MFQIQNKSDLVNKNIKPKVTALSKQISSIHNKVDTVMETERDMQEEMSSCLIRVTLGVRKTAWGTQIIRDLGACLGDVRYDKRLKEFKRLAIWPAGTCNIMYKYRRKCSREISCRAYRLLAYRRQQLKNKTLMPNKFNLISNK